MKTLITTFVLALALASTAHAACTVRPSHLAVNQAGQTLALPRGTCADIAVELRNLDGGRCDPSIYNLVATVASESAAPAECGVIVFADTFSSLELEPRHRQRMTVTVCAGAEACVGDYRAGAVFGRETPGRGEEFGRMLRAVRVAD